MTIVSPLIETEAPRFSVAVPTKTRCRLQLLPARTNAYPVPLPELVLGAPTPMVSSSIATHDPNSWDVCGWLESSFCCADQVAPLRTNTYAAPGSSSPE